MYIPIKERVGLGISLVNSRPKMNVTIKLIFHQREDRPILYTLPLVITPTKLFVLDHPVLFLQLCTIVFFRISV